MTGILSTLATIWRLAIPYFRSEDRWPGRVLLGAVLAIELAVVAVTVLLNQWNARFYNALQDRNWDTFVSELMFFCVLAASLVVLRVYQLYLNQWLQIRWRRWMTARYLEQWLEQANHYRMQLLGDAADNPDQRIAEDVQAVHRARTGGRRRPARIDRLARLVRRHPLGAVGRRAADDLWRRMEHPGLSGVGGARLRGSGHAADAFHRPAADPAQFQSAAL